MQRVWDSQPTHYPQFTQNACSMELLQQELCNILDSTDYVFTLESLRIIVILSFARVILVLYYICAK